MMSERVSWTSQASRSSAEHFNRSVHSPERQMRPRGIEIQAVARTRFLLFFFFLGIRGGRFQKIICKWKIAYFAFSDKLCKLTLLHSSYQSPKIYLFILHTHYTVALFCTHYTVFSSWYIPAKNVDILEGVQREASRMIKGEEGQTLLRRLKNEIQMVWLSNDGAMGHLQTLSYRMRQNKDCRLCNFEQCTSR